VFSFITIDFGWLVGWLVGWFGLVWFGLVWFGFGFGFGFGLVGWLFNGTSTQKGQFVPPAGRETGSSRLRMVNKMQCILSYVTR